MSKTIKINKQAQGTSYTGTWSGLVGGSEVEIVGVKNESYGFGSLANNYNPIANEEGSSAETLQEGVDFEYDEYLDENGSYDLYDDNTSGSFDAGKVIRVVENSKNVSDPTGLGLKVRAKNLETIVTPPKEEIYIDPANGKIVMPSPNYWSKCESLDNIEIIPEIKRNSIITKDLDSSVAFVSGKFGNCLRLYSSSYNQQIHIKYNGNQTGSDKGTVSVWVNGSIAGSAVSGVFGGISFPGQFINHQNITPFGIAYYEYASSKSYIRIYFGSDLIADYDHGYTTGFRHIYAMWDKDKGLNGGKSIRVFLNGTEILSTTENLPSMISTIPEAHIRNDGNSEGVYTYIDNLKIWNHVVSEDPSFEYNSGDGREEALHAIYSSVNDYKPSNLQIGGYYVADSDEPAKLAESESATGKVDWEF